MRTSTEQTDLPPGAYAVPDELDREVAYRKLETRGISIDELTDTQREYYEDWERGEAF